jgi:6-phosphogluconate dehydrogenase
MTSQIGLVGLAVMGQNLALNVAEKGFSISVFNRSYDKTEAAVNRAKKEGLDTKLTGYEDLKDFVASLEKPRRVIILVKAGAPVDSTIKGLMEYLEEGDIIIDGGNEWYENTERRQEAAKAKGIYHIGMGVSGGEEGARNGPSLMPGGEAEAYKYLEPIVTKVAAQVDDGPCVFHIGPGGAGNYVKMVHNGIEYGDMQLISEAYDVLKTVGGLTNDELAEAFAAYNKSELDSFLIEITAQIFTKKDDNGTDFIVDKILDKTGMKGTGKWTVQQAAELTVPAPTIEAALDGRFLSGLKDERVAAAEFYKSQGVGGPEPPTGVDKAQLIEDVKHALYAAKICSYAQGMNIIKAKSAEKGWNIDMGSLARI